MLNLVNQASGRSITRKSTGEVKMRRSFLGAFCLVLVAGLGTFATSAWAGPVYNTYAWQLAPGSGSISSGTFTIIGDQLQTPPVTIPPTPPFFSEADGFNTTFTYPTTVATGTAAGTQNITDIIDPTHANDNPGVIAINVNASDSSEDYLVEEIDLGYFYNQPQNLQPLFLSTDLLSFGQTTPTSGVYSFSFKAGPGTAFAAPGSTIGGLIENFAGGDIKTFTVVPAPSAAAGGVVLMLLLGAWRLASRMREASRPLSAKP
jgi:hypothetical protein